jgi:hypothetical protein
MPAEHIAISREKVRAFLNEAWLAEHGIDLVSQLDEIYSVGSGWNRQNSVVIIDGGDSLTREWVAHAVLFRCITNNSSEGVFGALALRANEIIAKFIQFGEERSVMLENLQRAPVLLINDISEYQPPTANSYGNVYFDEMLRGRHVGKRPTILSFAETDIETRNYGAVSRFLDEIVKNQQSPLRKIFRFRLN